MHVARFGHQATRLLDGRVLVTGGYDNAGRAVAQAEIFNAVTGTWSLIASNSLLIKPKTALEAPPRG